MQLTYRGISYVAQPTSVPKSPSHQMAVYRGHYYQISHNLTVKHQPLFHLKYRGIDY